MPNNVRLLDCTLRDGGHVNNACFGENVIKNIIRGLSDSKIEFIELGFLRDGSFTKDQSNYNDVSEIFEYLPENSESRYSVMIRPDWYDIDQLSVCDSRIDTIRFAFYYDDFALLEEQCKIVRTKGYNIICNPVNIMGYSEKELINLVGKMNYIHPEQLTIVDTFGSMNFDDLNRIYNILEEHLDKDIRIGLHTHENMSLAYGLVQEFLRIKETSRAALIDGSLCGMGRVPGNLCIEIVATHFNKYYGTDYKLDELYKLISKHILQIKKQHEWGYMPEYFVSASLNMHRSYAEYLQEKMGLSLEESVKILKEVEKEKHSKFDMSYIEKLVNI